MSVIALCNCRLHGWLRDTHRLAPSKLKNNDDVKTHTSFNSPLQQITNHQLKFKEVQYAYEILSDHQERSWYDSHRAEVLQAAAGAEKDKLSEFTSYVQDKCSTAAFTGFDEDDEDGFFQVYVRTSCMHTYCVNIIARE